MLIEYARVVQKWFAHSAIYLYMGVHGGWHVGNIDFACLSLSDVQKDNWALVDDGLHDEGSQYHDEGGAEG